MNIEENVALVKQRIRAAAGDRPVSLVAATKMNDADAIQRAIAAGIDASGENSSSGTASKNFISSILLCGAKR